MNIEQIKLYETNIREMISALQQLGAFLVLLCFAGYGFAIYLWFEHATTYALIVATLSYLVFRFIRGLTWIIINNFYKKKPIYQEIIKLIKPNMLGLTTEEIINLIYSEAAKKNLPLEIKED